MLNDIPIINVRGRTWHYIPERKPFCSISGCIGQATREAYVLAFLGEEEGFWLKGYLCEEHYKEKMREEGENV